MYKDIKAIYDREQKIFPMIVPYLMDIGWRTAEKITDEDIEKMEGNGLMTKDFCQHLCSSERDRKDS